MERTKPTGRVVGIDLIPAQPPRGVSTIQGNFLSPAVQATVKQFLAEEALRPLPADDAGANADDGGSPEPPQSYIDAGRQPSPPGDGGGRTVDLRAVSPTPSTQLPLLQLPDLLTRDGVHMHAHTRTPNNRLF